jgi:hypothetical protein
MTEPLIRSSNVEKSVPQGDSRLHLLRKWIQWSLFVMNRAAGF